MKWDEGLAAYDAEQIVLRQVAGAYDAYVKEFFECVRAGLVDEIAPEIGEPAPGEEAPHDWGLDWADEWLPEAAAVDVSAYNAGPFGRLVDRVVVELRLGSRLVDGWPTFEERLAKLDIDWNGMGIDADRVVLQTDQVELSADDGVQQVVARLTSRIREARTLNRSLAVGTALGAARWAADVMAQRRKEIFGSILATKVHGGRWAEGRFIQVDVQGNAVWLTIFADAHITAHWRGTEVANTAGAELVGRSDRWCADVRKTYSGARIVTPGDLADFASREDGNGLVSRLREEVGRLIPGAFRR